MFGQPVVSDLAKGITAKAFMIPPFTVLDTTGALWQEHKRNWQNVYKAAGIGKDETREGVATFSSTPGSFFANEIAKAGGEVSIFDPVLCEVAYRWFVPTAGQVLDPFCGGSVRGIVASSLGLKYWGADIRKEQVDANYKAADILLDPATPRPEWVCGDARDVVPNAPDADFVFSCPPYGDLEVYSDLPNDISNMDHSKFLEAYIDIIAKAVARLKENRFACFVVADFRDKKGYYRNFVSDTIAAFELAGARLYNECILKNAVGTGRLRVKKQFNTSRKMVKTHQNVLVFVKGDPRLATEACGAVDVPSYEDEAEEEQAA